LPIDDVREMRGVRTRHLDPARRVAFVLFALLALAAADVRAKQWFVETNGVAFVPQFITIQAGDSVTFLNRGGNHNVVADDGSFRCAHGCDDDGKGGNGNATSTLWIVTLSFPTPGTIGYFCEPHGAPGSGMYGTIEVVAPPPPPPVDPVPAGGARLDLVLACVLIAMALARLCGAGLIGRIRRQRR
jgi:plastocyanin